MVIHIEEAVGIPYLSIYRYLVEHPVYLWKFNTLKTSSSNCNTPYSTCIFFLYKSKEQCIRTKLLPLSSRLKPLQESSPIRDLFKLARYYFMLIDIRSSTTSVFVQVIIDDEQTYWSPRSFEYSKDVCTLHQGIISRSIIPHVQIGNIAIDNEGVCLKASAWISPRKSPLLCWKDVPWCVWQLLLNYPYPIINLRGNRVEDAH